MVGATERGKFATTLADLAKLNIAPHHRLLDIGTGNGDFLIFARENGYSQLSGHDIPGEDTARLTSAKIHVYKDYDYASVPDAAFDVATLLDVMEHVPDPRFVAREVLRVLKPGGVIYFHSPCVTITDRLMHVLQKIPLLGKIGRIWQRGRTSVFHLQNYTPRSVELILKEAGFTGIAIRTQNELSWPVRMYVQVYICEKHGLPNFLSYLLVPFLYPLLATSVFNANKAIVSARKSV